VIPPRIWAICPKRSRHCVRRNFRNPWPVTAFRYRVRPKKSQSRPKKSRIHIFFNLHHFISHLCSRGLSSCFYSFQGASEEPLFPRNNPMAMFVSLLGCGRRARARGGGVIENRKTSQSNLCLCTVSSVRIIRRRNIKASPSYFPHSSVRGLRSLRTALNSNGSFVNLLCCCSANCARIESFSSSV